MSHRFSNAARVRAKIAEAARPTRWQDIPLETRIDLLAHIQLLIEETLREFHS